MAELQPKNSSKQRLVLLTMRVCGLVAMLVGGFLFLRYIDRVDLQKEIQTSARIYLRRHLDQAERERTESQFEYPRILIDQLTLQQDHAWVNARMVTSKQEVAVKLQLTQKDLAGNWEVTDVLDIAYHGETTAGETTAADLAGNKKEVESVDRQIRTALENRPGIEVRTIR